MAGLAALTLTSVLTACGSSDSGAPTLTWYTNPDDGGQAEIAQRCTAAAGGRYTIATAVLPRQAAEQRQQLVRRLAVNDSSIDIMSLDPPFIPEFAQAGFLAPVPEDVAQRVTQDIVPSAIEGSTWKGELVAVPFWANTQLLWYRKSVAAAAGLDMSNVTWQQVFDAAAQQQTTIAAQGIRAESLTVFYNALIEGAGGTIIAQNAEDPNDIKLGIDSEAGYTAGAIMNELATRGLGGPALSTEDEGTSAANFESGAAAFQVNYPFIYPKLQGDVEKGSADQAVLDDLGWAVYPKSVADKDAAPPYGGISLGVGRASKHTDLAYEATECIQSKENQSYYFVSNGNPAANATVYDDPEVLAKFPMAPTILQSLSQAAPRPQTPYYSEVSGGLQRTYHPYESIQPQQTAKAAEDLITAVLQKKRLL
ncbi:ABC transporter substrate-binding protein [Rhodococcus aerolatus]